MSDSAEHRPMPPQDRDFWIAITLWGGALGTVFGYGLYALIEKHYSYGIGLTASGLVGLVYLTAHLRGRRLTPRVGAMAAMLAITWALIAYQIWHTQQPLEGFTQAQVDESVKAAVDPVRKELVAALDRAGSLQSQLNTARQPIPPPAIRRTGPDTRYLTIGITSPSRTLVDLTMQATTTTKFQKLKVYVEYMAGNQHGKHKVGEIIDKEKDERVSMRLIYEKDGKMFIGEPEPDQTNLLNLGMLNSPELFLLKIVLIEENNPEQHYTIAVTYNLGEAKALSFNYHPADSMCDYICNWSQ